MKKMCLVLVAVFMLALTTAYDADFQKGVNAARVGYFATASMEFGDLAEKGKQVDNQAGLYVLQWQRCFAEPCDDG